MARRVYTRTSYPARSAARRRAAAPKRRKRKKKDDDWTKWALVGSAVVLAFFVFRSKEAKAATIKKPVEPTSVVVPGRFVRAGISGQQLKCFDQIQGKFVQSFFCEQQDDASIDDGFFFPDELKG